MNSRRWISTPVRLLVLLTIVVLVGSLLRPGSVQAAGGLTINVVNQNGQPAASATWVDVYDEAGQSQRAAGYLNNGNRSFPDLPPGTYNVIVSSMGDSFQLHTRVEVTTNSVLNMDARSGTIPVTFKGIGRDGNALGGAVFTIAPQSILAVSGRIGFSYPDGNLPAIITPGVYTVALQDHNRLLRLDLPDQDLSQPTTVVVNEAAIATGKINVILEGTSEGSFRVHRSPNAGSDLSIGVNSTITASVGELWADLELYKTDASNRLWNLGLSPTAAPFDITAGSEITVRAGGRLSATLLTPSKASRGGSAWFFHSARDAYNNRVNYLAVSPPAPAMLKVTDAAGQVLYERAVSRIDDETSFNVPVTAALGAASATISIDTGPFQGMLSASAGFEIDASRQCFEQTGQCAQGRLVEYWNRNGGLSVFGYPLAEEALRWTPDGIFVTQTFERNRLELHPENAAPYDVLLGRLGADLLSKQGRPWDTLPQEEPRADCKFFPDTRHNVCEPFLSYWRSHGLDLGDPGVSERESLALFGLPITTPAMEKNSSGDTVMTQWFERARFEHHSENAPPYDILLGRLGAESR